MNTATGRRHVGLRISSGLAITASLLSTIASPSPAGASGDSEEVPSITVASQPNSAGLPIWLADELGYFEDNRLDVEIQLFPTGAAMSQAGASGDWSGGWMGAPPALNGATKWDLISSGIMFKEIHNQIMFVRQSDLEGTTAAELVEGSTILVVTNSTSHQAMFGCLNQLGVDPSDVNVVPLDPPAVVQAFQSGEGDVAMSWAENDFPLSRDPAYVSICDGTDAGVDVYCVYNVAPDFWSDDPDAAARYVEAVYSANEFINDNPEEAVEYLVEYYNEIGLEHDSEDAELAMTRREFYTLEQAIEAFESGDAQLGLQATADFFVDQGVWQDAPDIDAVASTGLEVLTAAMSYRESAPDQAAPSTSAA